MPSRIRKSYESVRDRLQFRRDLSKKRGEIRNLCRVSDRVFRAKESCKAALVEARSNAARLRNELRTKEAQGRPEKELKRARITLSVATKREERLESEFDDLSNQYQDMNRDIAEKQAHLDVLEGKTGNET